jgi:hypothetical protein
MTPRRIEPSVIVPLPEYAAQRADRRRRITELKKNRRLEVGPFATFYFESYDTMLHQVQEMLFIEKGGAEQLPDELAAYNPLIPQGSELVATVMFEIDDPLRRARVLATLGGVENRAFIRLGGDMIRGVPEADQERSREDGKASSVQFVRFGFTPAHAAAFKSAVGDVVVGFDHPNYGHMAVMPAAVRAALALDFA